MRKLLVLALLAGGAIAIVYGLRGAGGVVGTPEHTLRQYFDARKAADIDAMLDCVDLQGSYEKENTGTLSYTQYENTVRLALGLAFKFEREQARHAFECDLLGTRDDGAVTLVSIRTRPDSNSEWKHNQIPVKRVRRRWKITAAGWGKLIDDTAPRAGHPNGQGN